MRHIATVFYNSLNHGAVARTVGRFSFLALIVLLGSIFAGPACGDTALVSNLGNPGSGLSQISTRFENSLNPQFPSGEVGFTGWNSFSTGPSAIELTRISISFTNNDLQVPTPNPAIGSGFSAQLLSDTAGAPGSVLATLNGNASPISAGVFDYAPTGAFSLAPNTIYWLLADVSPRATTGDPADRRFYITTTSNPAQTGLAGWSIGDTSGGQFRTFDFPPGAVGDPFRFAVYGIIPEPGSLGMLLISAGLMFVRRRTRPA